MAIGLLRQQLAPGQMAHGIVTDGGQATNVIPAHAELQYTMRAADAASLRDLEERMAGLLPGRCGRHRLRLRRRPTTSPPYEELTPGPAGWPRCSAPRWCGCGRTPVPADVEAALPLGSTDMGNVTQVMPGIHPIVGVDAGGASVHQPAFAAAAAGPSADKAVVDGAIMLARTVVALAETPARTGPGAGTARRSGWRR